MKKDHAKPAEIMPFRRILMATHIKKKKNTLKTMNANEIIFDSGNYVCQNPSYIKVMTKMIFLLYISETSL